MRMQPGQGEIRIFLELREHVVRSNSWYQFGAKYFLPQTSYKYKLLILSIRRQNIMMNRKKQRTIAVIICVILIISMLAGILLPYVVD